MYYDLVNQANKIYGNKNWKMYFAPGRVNLLGEHIDYNGGNVFPCAINLGIYGLVNIRKDKLVRCYSQSFKKDGIISFNLDLFTKDNNWVDYIKAIIKTIDQEITGFDLYIDSDLPNQAGLSSSAAIELLMIRILVKEFNLDLDLLKQIKVARDAENQYIGVMCGIMDQFAIAYGRKNKAIYLDTKTLDFELVDLCLKNYTFVIANTNKKRTLADSKYNQRRQECEQALRLINPHKDYLTELSLEDIACLDSETLLKRARHVITEHHRVKLGKESFESGDIFTFGQLMYQSHYSLANDYEVSCYELDCLVELFKEAKAIGARMTGAGFGGCVIALVDNQDLDKLTMISQQYQAKTGLIADFYHVKIGDGARHLSYDINLYLNELIQYGINEGILDRLDYHYTINSLMDLFDLKSFHQITSVRSLGEILEDIANYGYMSGLINDDVTAFDNFKAKVVDLLIDKPSIVNQKFNSLLQKSHFQATQYLYNLCLKVDYIKAARISKNIKWTYKSSYGLLIMTINLSKPEKDPIMIANKLTEQEIDYPRCQLCIENEGFLGYNKESRRNLRTISLTLNNEHWYFQYSPYSYFNEHGIVFYKEHKPMNINKDTFKRFVKFLTIFPSYFIGSNADLPIVGGSILTHEHYQIGHQTMPIENAQERFVTKIKDVDIYLLNWPLSTIRIKTKDQKQFIEIASLILNKWKQYQNPELNIINSPIQHNAITPIARYNKQWEMDIILRNNYTTKDRPLGVFHPRSELHHIKKENIGLIEAMGIAILPGRLKSQLQKIQDILNGSVLLDRDLQIHQHWIEDLKLKFDNTSDFLLNQLGLKFEEVLKDAGVFKDFNEFEDFIKFAFY